MKANSKTIRRMKVNVRSEESKSKHSTFETTFQNWKENGEDVALLMPEFSAKWLPIAEESGSWSGWVLLREIFPLISVRETNEVALAVRKYAKEIGIPIITDKKLARKIYATHRRYDYVSFENIDEILRLLLWLEDVENAGQPVPDEQLSSEDKYIEGEDTKSENNDNNLKN